MSSDRPTTATITMTVEHFASKEAEVVATTEKGRRITRKTPIEGVRSRFPAGKPVEVCGSDEALKSR